ncbi:gamma-aminobutyric acid receptor subunit alpha-3 isoform X14 [Drosophila pseudoobscura]|uniref:Gamma-aminobutyric acid receptor subunit alpha-3 isoform X14 n=1 Tax=Drosophila pseudoobscura pseudoobscura TaxID=46245 RepID=A0A6I8W541_DROPS|nr:gamma-aminobutyric acid receptor subunit alpha-3 isoform X14 [Drosophila pseudoobscura]
MGCVFEAAKEQPNNKKPLTRAASKQLRRNQCGARGATATTTRPRRASSTVRVVEGGETGGATTTTTPTPTTEPTTTLRPAEDIKIKDNYQQNHKTKTQTQTQTQTETTTEIVVETQTETANAKHLKAGTRVLLTIQQQQQQQPQKNNKNPSQVAHKDKEEDDEDEDDDGENDELATTHGTTIVVDRAAAEAAAAAAAAAEAAAAAGIDIEATTKQNQTLCPNCLGHSPEISRERDRDRDEQQLHRQNRRRRRLHPDADATAVWGRIRPGLGSTAVVAATLAGISTLSLHEMLLHARAALATSLQWQVEQGQDDHELQEQELEGEDPRKQPLAYQPWRDTYASSGILPATMSAAIIANVSATAAATSAAAYQYLGQHYKHYSQSFSFYAASSVILMLCYLTSTSTAAATQSETGALDKHPIHGIDWSKFDESSSDKEILDLLLEKKRYDKRLLPPVNDEDFCCGLQSPDMATNQNPRRPHNRGTLTVNVNVLLLSLASPDESSLKYEVEFLLNQQWNDPRLQYGNKSHYDFLNALHHHDSIWTPDTYFIMHGDFKDPIIPMHFALRIFRNGTITYAMRRHLILSCQGSLHIFPFDDPKCSFSMESISYEESQIKYVWKNDEDTLRKSPSLTTLNAYLIKNQTTPCDQNSWRGNYSCLRVDLIFTRDRAFYFTTVFIPGIILVTSSFITFWLEWNAVPARSMIGVTTMLNFFTTSNGFRSTLPVVSNLTAMNVWDGVCMCFIYASLLEFVCVNYVGRKRPLHNVVYRPGENPVTQRLPAVLSRIGVILASPLPGEKRRDAGAPNEIVACTTCGGSNSPCTHSANNGCATETCFVQVRKKEPPHPIRVAKTIDVIARITFPTAYAIFLVFFFVHYKGFS